MAAPIDCQRELEREGKRDCEDGQDVANAWARSHSLKTDAPLAEQRCELPIWKHRSQILYLVEKYPVVIVVGHTGCGKTTQIPQFLHEQGWTSNGRMIGCTQPRRVAVSSVAQRVADEVGDALGGTVGYAIRFEDRTSKEHTRIKYMTDGMLLREMMMDPLLSRYNVLMIDEAHERSLCTDMVLGLLKLVMVHRKDLRIVVSSATLDAEALCKFFKQGNDEDQAMLLSLEGQTFPLDIHYLESPCENYVSEAISSIIKIHENEPPGDILVFLTGREEVDTVVSKLDHYEDRNKSGLIMFPVGVYSGMSQREQLKIFEPTPRGHRKVVVATNIAETSITIDDIVYVIDCGHVKSRVFEPATLKDALIVEPTSQASANQRAGRAGRVRPGKVYRLYPRREFDYLRPLTLPEIARGNLTQMILQLKYLRVRQVATFPYLTVPNKQNFARSLELLYIMGAVDESGDLTEMGEKMAEMPIQPALAAVLLSAHEYGCASEILTIVSMLTLDSVFVGSKTYDDAGFKQMDFAVEEGDHLTYLNVFLAFQQSKGNSTWCHRNHVNYQAMCKAQRTRKQLAKFLAKHNIPVSSNLEDTVAIRKCLVKGFFTQAAVSQPDGSYRSLRDGSTLWVHPASVLFERMPQYVVYHEIVETNRAFMRDVLAVDPQWLLEAAPTFYEFRDVRKEMRQMYDTL